MAAYKSNPGYEFLESIFFLDILLVCLMISGKLPFKKYIATISVIRIIIMKQYLNKLLFLSLTFLLNSCLITQTGYSAPPGFIYQETTINHVFPKSTDLGSRMGTSCIQSYLGLWSTGDAGIRASAAEGGITTIRAVDYKIHNVFFFYMQTCTIVYGE